MGQRGPKPKPLALKMLAGQKVKPAAGSPKFTPGVPSCPSWLGKRAKAVYRRVAAELDAAGILTHADADALGAYAAAVADLESLSAQIDREGLMIEAPVHDRNGKAVGKALKAHPGLKWRQDLLNKVRQLAAEFGLTPSSRARAGAVAGPAAPTPETNKVLEIRARIEAARAGG